MVSCSALRKLTVENVIHNLEKEDEYKIMTKKLCRDFSSPCTTLTKKNDIQYMCQWLGTVVPLVSWDLPTPCHMMPTGCTSMPHERRVAVSSCAPLPKRTNLQLDCPCHNLQKPLKGILAACPSQVTVMPHFLGIF